MIRTADFDYPLDETLIAQQPLERRDESRLMVLNRASGRLDHRVFRELPSLLRPGDLLVVNQTRVVPARFLCRRRTGGRVEGLFLRQERPGEWEVLLRDARRCAGDEELSLQPPAADPAPQPAATSTATGQVAPPPVSLRLLGDLGDGRWRVAVSPPLEANEVLARFGATPLPPYIRRKGSPQEALDRPRYQTVYAAVPGAAAAPTAGLHFTPALLAELKERGIEMAPLTLHVGLGTFRPVKEEDLTRHHMHAEWYDLPTETANALNEAHREGRRIVAVGTTSLRVLETVASELRGAIETVGASKPTHRNGSALAPPARESSGAEPAGLFRALSGWTDLFVYPPREFHSAGALITNFHLPRSTLLMLVAAFCSPGGTEGIEMLRRAYAEAQRLRYRFYSYGDAMLIE